MTGKGISTLGVKIRTRRRMGWILRRQHERRFRIMELGCDRLHLFCRKADRIEHHGERIATECGVGEHIGGDITSAHRDAPLGGERYLREALAFNQ